MLHKIAHLDINSSCSLLPAKSTSFFHVPEAISTSTTSILFCVSVPVLSVQITLVPPKVSTADNFFTITLYRDILSIPLAKVMVATMGNPSGIAATANATEV